MKTEESNQVQLVESSDGRVKLINLPDFGNGFKQFTTLFGKASNDARNLAKQYADRQHDINMKKAVLFSKNHFEIKLHAIIADVLKSSGKFKVIKRLVDGGTRFELIKL